MSDFSERIRDARLELVPIPPRLVRAEPPPPMPAERQTVDELEAQRRRVETLARKVDELNAAILGELLQHPQAVTGGRPPSATH
jgi:hypothetical protein